MVKLHRFVFNSFQVNTFILYDDTGECIIIDPANYTEEENAKLSEFITSNNLNPLMQLYTHGHIDHVLGLHFIKDKYEIPYLAHKLETPLLNNAPMMGEMYGFKVKPLPPPDNYLSDGDTIRFGESKLLAIHVPGHSEGSLAYYSEVGRFLISGDVLFAGSIGRTDLPGGDYDTLIRSITKRLFILPPNTLVWPGHGDSSTIGNEIETNPFF